MDGSCRHKPFKKKETTEVRMTTRSFDVFLAHLFVNVLAFFGYGRQGRALKMLRCFLDLHPKNLSKQAETCGPHVSIYRVRFRHLIRYPLKEVIQPQVPLRLPCYDFTPVAVRSVGGCLPCGLAHRLRVQTTPMV